MAEAVSFLTVVPLGSGVRPFELGPALAWFPLVGGAIGALAGGLRVVGGPLFGAAPSTVLAMVGLVAVSGGLHQDALADSADGLGVRGDRARRLAAMRDSATGAFGVLALIGWALLLFTALRPLSAVHALRALVAAAATGRLAALWHGRAAPPARRDGLGAAVQVSLSALVIATGLAAGIAWLAVGPVRAALTLGVCGVVSAASAAAARRALGGSTGDTLGAAVALTEVCVSLALLASWR